MLDAANDEIERIKAGLRRAAEECVDVADQALRGSINCKPGLASVTVHYRTPSGFELRHYRPPEEFNNPQMQRAFFHLLGAQFARRDCVPFVVVFTLHCLCVDLLLTQGEMEDRSAAGPPDDADLHRKAMIVARSLDGVRYLRSRSMQLRDDGTIAGYGDLEIEDDRDSNIDIAPFFEAFLRIAAKDMLKHVVLDRLDAVFCDDENRSVH